MYLVSFGDQVSHKKGLTVVKCVDFEATVDALLEIVKEESVVLNFCIENGYSAIFSSKTPENISQ